jgi:hypothetical protein
VTLVEDIKLAVRVASSAYDAELEGHIAASKARLRRGGVSATVVNAEEDPLLIAAITVYCKAMFGLDNPDSEKYMAAFDSMMVVLALSEDDEADVS